MKKLSITRKESIQNLISSLLLATAFLALGCISRTTLMRVLFLIPGVIFSVYSVVWLCLFIYLHTGKRKLEEPPEAEDEPEEEINEPVPVKERVHRTYKPLTPEPSLQDKEDEINE